jgi:hypothetical protein
MRAAQLVKQLVEATYYSPLKKPAARPYGGMDDIVARPGYSHSTDPTTGFNYRVYLPPNWQGWPSLSEEVDDVILPPEHFHRVPGSSNPVRYVASDRAPRDEEALRQHPQLMAAAKRLVARSEKLAPPAAIKKLSKRADYVKGRFTAVGPIEAVLQAISGLKYSVSSPSTLGYFARELEPGEVIHTWDVKPRVDRYASLKLAVAGTPAQLERARRLFMQQVAFKETD